MICSVQDDIDIELFKMTFGVFERSATKLQPGICLLPWPLADSEHVVAVPKLVSNRSQMKYNFRPQNQSNTMFSAAQEHTQRWVHALSLPPPSTPRK